MRAPLCHSRFPGKRRIRRDEHNVATATLQQDLGAENRLHPQYLVFHAAQLKFRDFATNAPSGSKPQRRVRRIYRIAVRGTRAHRATLGGSTDQLRRHGRTFGM